MWSMPIDGVTSAQDLNSFCQANFTAKNKLSFHGGVSLAKAPITPSMWSNISLYTVITWCNVTVCLIDIHRVQYQNGLNTSMTYFTMVHSSRVVKSGRWSLCFGFLSHSGGTSSNQKVRSSNYRVEFQQVVTSIIESTAMRTLAFWQSMNPFRQPGDSVIYTVSIVGSMKVSFSTFRISWNTYFLNNLC